MHTLVISRERVPAQAKFGRKGTAFFWNDQIFEKFFLQLYVFFLFSTPPRKTHIQLIYKHIQEFINFIQRQLMSILYVNYRQLFSICGLEECATHIGNPQ